jgi:hypothetical protein
LYRMHSDVIVHFIRLEFELGELQILMEWDPVVVFYFRSDIYFAVLLETYITKTLQRSPCRGKK